MDINGLQKLTLLDFPGHTACTVFLTGCDFRCPFCHNFELTGAAPAVMTDGEFFSFLGSRKGLLDGVAITGGEPTLRKDLPEFVAKIKDLGYGVKLDSNGNHPEVLHRLLDGKLVDYIAMDIKNDRARYALTCGLDQLDPSAIDESIHMLIGEAPDYEFRTTAVAQLHDEKSFEDIGRRIQGAKRYFIQAFTDRESVPFAGFSAPEKEMLEKYASIVKAYVQEVGLRGV